MKLRTILIAPALCAVAFTAVGPSSAGASQGLPVRPVPAGLHAVAGNAGGRILEGSLPGGGSSDDAFRSALARVRTYFDRPPHVVGAVRSNDQTLTLALFKATLGGAPVGGYVLTTYVARGTSRVDVLFDRVSRAQQSLRPMLAQIAAMHPANAGDEPRGTVAALHKAVSPDGSVHVLLAAGWRAPIFAQGQFGALGPDEAEVDQEIGVPLQDPSGPMYRQEQQLSASTGGRIPNQYIGVPYTNDVERAFLAVSSALMARGVQPPAQISIAHVSPSRSHDGGTSAEITGTSVRKGTTYRFDGIILVTPPNQMGGWIMYVKMIQAPAEHWGRDLPTLLAIFDSYNVDQRVRNGQVAETLEADREGAARGQAFMSAARSRNAAVFDASMSHARSVQDGIDRSTSGFVHYLNDTTVIENANGARATADAGFAQSVVDNDSQFRIVPVSEYRSGD
jgi:hypothetical protein